MLPLPLNLNFKPMDVQEFFKIYDIERCGMFESCERCALGGKEAASALCGNYFHGCPLPPFFYFKHKNRENP